MANSFLIGDKRVGGGAPCFVIAEVGLGHDGSLGAAFAYAKAAAEAGADAVKFQTHMAAEESTPREQFRVKVFPQDATRFDYWTRTAFTEEQWAALKTHCESLGVVFLSSPFSVAAVRLLRRLGVKAWKIGSGESNNLLMLEEIASRTEPVLLSTGMSFWSEIDTVVELFRTRGVPVALLQCTSRYPCPPEAMGLNLIPEYARKYGVPAGFSDHSGEIAPGLAAVVLGASVLEVHVTWHKKSFGPDVSSSLTIEQLTEQIRGIRLVERALASSVEKDASTDSLREMRRLFNKGLVARDSLAAGTALTVERIDAKKPCIGIPASDYQSVLGRRVKRAIERDQHITWEDLE